MRLRLPPVSSLAWMVVLAWPVALAAVGDLSSAQATEAPAETTKAADGVRALDGEWVFVEDRTEGRAVEDQQPSMSARVNLRVEQDAPVPAVVLIRTSGEIRINLDGSATEVTGEGGNSISRYRGHWKDNVFTYESESVRLTDLTSTGLIRWELRLTDEGMVAGVVVDPPTGFRSVALYQHPELIALPEPAKTAGGIADVAWIAGDWIGTRGSSNQISIEERWSPPLGGAMLAVSRTVSRNRMSAFEYLRIVERSGGLVYIAQPNGAAKTEFVLTELKIDGDQKRAVFENPRHDFPQRIVYELSADGALSASIGYARGGKPQRFEFKREEP